MGKRGPRPEPTVIKMAKGNPGNRPLNKREARPDRTAIEPPEYLSGKSLEKWNHLEPILNPCGLLTQADVETLGRYCTMWEQWCKYLEQCRRGLDVLVLKDDNGKVKYMQTSPAASQLNKLAQSMLRIEQEFGMTPSARTGISATDEKKNPLDEFIA